MSEESNDEIPTIGIDCLLNSNNPTDRIKS